MRRILCMLAAVALSACAASGTSGGLNVPDAQSAPGVSLPSGSLELGDWRRGSIGVVARDFGAAVDGRYQAGLALADARDDLRRAGFRCGESSDASQATMVCRHDRAAGECSNEWNVYLFGDVAGERVSRARGIYDRQCGDGDLLGGL